ncbi:hypothetical protein KM043_013377 [Ampulex compressa]|nr:hypothetical protein KM043_013377 [Ampulex compressa]
MVRIQWKFTSHSLLTPHVQEVEHITLFDRSLFKFLAPRHFLAGSSPLSVPNYLGLSKDIEMLTRLQLVQQMQESFGYNGERSIYIACRSLLNAGESLPDAGLVQ